MTKSRTQNKFINAVIGAARTAFMRYSPKYHEVRMRNRIELEKLKKDGTKAKKPDVYYKCELCGRMTKDGKKDPEDPNKGNNVDHIDPVVEFNKTRSDYTLTEYLERLDCDISNLQLICIPCHDEKTKKERAIRQKFKDSKK